MLSFLTVLRKNLDCDVMRAESRPWNFEISTRRFANFIYLFHFEGEQPVKFSLKLRILHAKSSRPLPPSCTEMHEIHAKIVERVTVKFTILKPLRSFTDRFMCAFWITDFAINPFPWYLCRFHENSTEFTFRISSKSSSIFCSKITIF